MDNLNPEVNRSPAHLEPEVYV